MKVRLLAPFQWQGTEGFTGKDAFKGGRGNAGEVVDAPAKVAAILLKQGRAEKVTAAKEAPKEGKGQ